MQCNVEFEYQLNICDKDEENKGRRIRNLEPATAYKHEFHLESMWKYRSHLIQNIVLSNEKDEPAKTIKGNNLCMSISSWRGDWLTSKTDLSISYLQFDSK
jgi:hypothetical protein